VVNKTANGHPDNKVRQDLEENRLDSDACSKQYQNDHNNDYPSFNSFGGLDIHILENPCTNSNVFYSK